MPNGIQGCAKKTWRSYSFGEEYEVLSTVLMCGMAVIAARMTRTKRDVVWVKSFFHVDMKTMFRLCIVRPSWHKIAWTIAVCSQKHIRKKPQRVLCATCYLNNLLRNRRKFSTSTHWFVYKPLPGHVRGNSTETLVFAQFRFSLIPSGTHPKKFHRHDKPCPGLVQKVPRKLLSLFVLIFCYALVRDMQRSSTETNTRTWK